MMKRRIPAALCAAALLLVLLSGCGGSSGYSDAASDAEYPYDDFDEAFFAAGVENAAPEYYGGSGYVDSKSASRAAEAPAASDPSLPRKLILTASVTLETTAYEETTAALSDLTARLGGYYASATSGERGGSSRWANYTVRIPSSKFDEFLDTAGTICHELRRSENRDDISERYYDTQGRLGTQQKKLARLQDLLEQAVDMEDIITIMSAISETEETIESLQGTLNRWDNQVDYATIELELTEVARLSNVEVLPDSYATRLGQSFLAGVSDFFGWLGDILVSLAYGWLWLALLAAIIVVIVRVSRKRAAKAAEKAAKAPAAPPEQSLPRMVHPPMRMRQPAPPKEPAAAPDRSGTPETAEEGKEESE